MSTLHSASLFGSKETELESGSDLDRVSAILIIIAVILCFLLAMAFRQPLPLGINSALNNTD